MVKIQYDKIFQEQISNSFKNIKKETIKNNDEKNKIFDIKKFSSNNKKVRAHKYFLEGNVIKLYVVENGIKTKCLKKNSFRRGKCINFSSNRECESRRVAYDCSNATR